MRQSIPYDKEMDDEEKAKLAGLEAIYGEPEQTAPISSDIMNTVDQDYVNKLTELPVNSMDNFSMVPQQSQPLPKQNIVSPISSPNVKSDLSLSTDSSSVQSERAAQLAKVKQSLAEKYGLNKYSDEERAKLLSDVQKDRDSQGFDWSGMIAGIGAGLQGKSVSDTMDTISKARETKRTQKLADFDKQREQTISKIKFDQEMKDYEDKDTLRAREQDINSQESQLARTLAGKMLPSKDFSQMTAAQINKALPSLTKMYEIEQKKLDRQDARSLLGAAKQEKLDEKLQQLKTPVGIANTIEDAKNLKEGFESKKNFDAKIQEMIDLRKQYGGEAFNREAVARGKQLSKDLLLEYKNMAKLGVLSKSDEDILNAIIPSDPLAFKPLEAATGQDSILATLEKFKADSDRDFYTKVSTRTREGLKNQQTQQSAPQQEGKRSWSKK